MKKKETNEEYSLATANLKLLVAILFGGVALFLGLFQFFSPSQTQPSNYVTSSILLEDDGAGNIEEISVPLERMGKFSLVHDGEKFYLWQNTHTNQRPRVDFIHMLESEDGITWSNRQNTDLEVLNDNGFRYLRGLDTVIKNDDGFEGWGIYYYESTLGWAMAIRYVTSEDGVDWTVVSQPSQIGGSHVEMIKIDDDYHNWSKLDVDSRLNPNFEERMQYRTSTLPNAGWGDWQTGGIDITIDGNTTVNQVAVKRNDIEGFNLFELSEESIRLAYSDNGYEFTTQIEELVDLDIILPNRKNIVDFEAVAVEGETWFYFVYRDQDERYRFALSRPEPESVQTISNQYLPLIAQEFSFPSLFPIFISDVIVERDIQEPREVFYTHDVQIPQSLPENGRFFLSASQDNVAPIVVDDELAIQLNGSDIFTFDFSTQGRPVEAIVELPLGFMNLIRGEEISIKYRDKYGSKVASSEVWLIWISD